MRRFAPCASPGCPALTREGRCAVHQPAQRDRSSEGPRPSASQRGYDATWRKRRLMHLRAHPLCAECGRVATDVDHIVPLARGGTGADDNLQSLCHGCHSRKTNREDGGGWRR